MKISIEKEVFKKFHPQFQVAFILFKGIDNKTRLKESKELLKDVEKVVRLTFNKDSVKTHHLISPWNVAKQEFGKEAKHYHTSVELLLKSVLSKKKVAVNDVLTNLIRYLALKQIIPIGIDDPQKIEGEMVFSIAGTSGEEKNKFNGIKNLSKGELYYHDQKKVLGTKLDYWKNEKTKLTAKSTSALVHFEALPPFGSEQLIQLLKEAVDLIRSFCGGEVKVFVLNKNNLSTEL
ncbi:MAG TPA: phenylalanine--tRNA ligase beta subunit-related protein [Candidatus Nanoarchaeia archaeon]|nr:phenylalanine--tRNA ligase beta subunit-related protein [Candidatus Nanoarchaeia archaeon]